MLLWNALLTPLHGFFVKLFCYVIKLIINPNQTQFFAGLKIGYRRLDFICYLLSTLFVTCFVICCLLSILISSKKRSRSSTFELCHCEHGPVVNASIWFVHSNSRSPFAIIYISTFLSAVTSSISDGRQSMIHKNTPKHVRKLKTS